MMPIGGLIVIACTSFLVFGVLIGFSFGDTHGRRVVKAKVSRVVRSATRRQRFFDESY